MDKLISFLIISFLILLISCKERVNQKKELSQNVIEDADGNQYKTIRVNDQVWMQENLKVKHFQNGDPIPEIQNDSLWLNIKKGAFCKYENDPENEKIYGLLYNWYAVNDPRKVCPAGWKVPSDTDFAKLDKAFWGPNDAGQYLKEAGFSHWEKPNTGNNESGFTALPGGHRDQGFSRKGKYAFFWNRYSYHPFEKLKVDSDDYATECSLCFESSYFNQDWGAKNRGMSIRCIKDSTIKRNKKYE